MAIPEYLDAQVINFQHTECKVAPQSYKYCAQMTKLHEVPVLPPVFLCALIPGDPVALSLLMMMPYH